jgi:putative DNA methylase
VCGAEVPLLSSLDLAQKRGQERWLRPIVTGGHVEFDIASGPRTAEPNKRGQGARFNCWVCDSAITPSQVHDQLDVATKPQSRLLALVAAGDRRREYLAPTPQHLAAAAAANAEAERIRSSDDSLSPTTRGTFGGNAQGKRYGFFSFADYFTNRQLVALTTFSDLVIEARERVLRDARTAGAPRGDRLESGGTDAEAYADAVATYLGFVVSKMTNLSSALTSWMPDRGAFREVFARQAVPVVWGNAEANVLFPGGGGWLTFLMRVTDVVGRLDAGTIPGEAVQSDAGEAIARHAALSTDPPYYDNIVYSDLSDFFYVWLRRSLREVHPELLSTMLVPKADELVANSYRHEGRDGAKDFFEDGFRRVFAGAREAALADVPVTVYYAFKQSEASDDGTASTGWETLLDGMIRSRWAITATWPMRTESAGRVLGQRTNVLASSIVLALRPRPDDAPTTDRRGLIAALHNELPDALRKLQQGTIAPVDLPQAAIGPGMAVFSRYAKVIENDGTTMTVRSALARINEILDQVLNEQEGDFDAATRFAIAWYRQHGYTTGKFGVADDLARARNTAVETMVRDGILTSAAGKVTLLSPANMPQDYDVLADDRVGAWEVLHHLIESLEREGVPIAGAFLANAQQRPDGAIDLELLKELAFLLFSIAEKNGWTQDALAFNTVATAWPDVVHAARSPRAQSGEQGAFDFEED